MSRRRSYFDRYIDWAHGRGEPKHGYAIPYVGFVVGAVSGGAALLSGISILWLPVVMVGVIMFMAVLPRFWPVEPKE